MKKKIKSINRRTMKKWMSENFKIILIIVFCVIEMDVEELKKNYVFNMISNRTIG